MNKTDRTKAIEETQAQQAAYYAWVDEARVTGHNMEADVFRAGWAAARAYASAEAAQVK